MIMPAVTEAALKAVRVQEGLLHRMQPSARPALDRGDLLALGAERGHQARVHRHAVHPHGAGAAIAGVAAFLHAQRALFAQEGAQALAGGGCASTGLPLIFICLLPPASSARICSAKWRVTCRLYAARAVDVVEVRSLARQRGLERLARTWAEAPCGSRNWTGRGVAAVMVISMSPPWHACVPASNAAERPTA
jgi:hypothetical protein